MKKEEKKAKKEEVEEKEERKKNKSKGLKLKTKLIISSLVLILIVGLILGIIGIFNNDKGKQVLLDFGFKDVGKLVTQEWYGRIIKDESKDRKFFEKYPIPGTKSRIIFSLDVEVIAGVEFNKIEWNLDDTKKVVNIKMPKSKIYKYYQVPNTFECYLEDESWFTNMSSEWRHKLEDEVVEEGRKQAIKLGILDKADKNAKTIIRQMIHSNEKTKDYKVEFEYK